MSHRLMTITGLALTLTALGAGWLGAQSASTMPAFKITARNMMLDLDQMPKMLVYEGGVKFISPVNDTSIICARLEANAVSAKDISAVQAKGDVVINMTIEPKEKGKPSYKLLGKAQLMTYTFKEGTRTIRLLKEGGVRPSLVLTDLTSKEVTDLTGTGDIIEYNLLTRKLEVRDVEMRSEGGQP
jgi:hypothetical protein